MPALLNKHQRQRFAGRAAVLFEYSSRSEPIPAADNSSHKPPQVPSSSALRMLAIRVASDIANFGF